MNQYGCLVDVLRRSSLHWHMLITEKMNVRMKSSKHILLLRLTICHYYSSSVVVTANSYIKHPTPKTLSHLLSQRPPLSILEQLHAKIITQSLSSHFSLTDSLIHCYLSTKTLTRARTLFDRYPSPSPPILLWNLMIRAYSKLEHSPEPINLFRRMIALDIVPDNYTFTFLITSCSHQMSELVGMTVHGVVMKNGCLSNLYLGNSITNLYSVFGKMDHACKLFEEMLVRDVFSWTSLVRGYAKLGEMDRACELFDMMPVHNEVSWTVIISGFLGCERYVEALQCFHGMLRGDDNVKPSEAVLVCALSACAHLGALDQGKWIHVYIDKNRFTESSNISTALIDMYAKCGNIDCASRVFYKIFQPDVLNYTSMIMGFSIHGLGNDALRTFYRMSVDNVTPNEVTIIAVLNGCSHSGLVEDGSSIFNKMENSWRIVPKIEHYGCYVDLLARAGYLGKAFSIVKNMPMDPDVVIWRTLLSACRVYLDVDYAKEIMNLMGQLRVCNGGEVLVSNLYASLSVWSRVHQVRKVMGKRSIDVSKGCSWIEVNGVIHEFRVDDQLHPQIDYIRNKLNEIFELNRLGEFGSSSFDFIEEEERASSG